VVIAMGPWSVYAADWLGLQVPARRPNRGRVMTGLVSGLAMLGWMVLNVVDLFTPSQIMNDWQTNKTDSRKNTPNKAELFLKCPGKSFFSYFPGI